ncbi:MAG: hypothetical protein C4321_08415, partial [Chloroflexota bacterium]
GDLSEAVWKGAPLATGFTRETRPPTEDTRVWAAYDATHLYFAFECPDARPDQIHNQQKKRNGSLDSDDWVSVGIDPLGDKKTIYWFQVNPIGTQAEEIPGGAASKVEWRGDWSAAAKVGEHGWTAEMAIPFSILKYPPGQKQFGLIFRRNLARIGEETSWPSGTNYYMHENQAWWQGLVAPRQRAVARYMPYTLLGAGGNLKNGYGVDLKYVTPNNVTSLLAIRPDFQTIEDVIDTVDFSYSPRFLRDRRPFFTEGGDFFGDGMMFYSRNVGEIDTGFKSFGKIGRVAFGAMDTTRFGGENNLLLNAGYDVTDHSDVRLAMVRHDGDTENTVLKLAANWQRPAKVNGYYWGVALLQNSGNGPESVATRAYVDRYAGSGMLGWHLFYNRIPKEYQPELAFVPETDKHSIGAALEYGKEYQKGPLRSWWSEMGLDYATHLTGGLFYEGVSPGLFLTFRKNWSLGLNYNYSNRPPNRDRVMGFNVGLKIRDIYRQTQLNFRSGRLDGGDYMFAALRQGFKLSEKFSLALSVEKLSLNYPDDREDLDVTQGVLSGVYDFTAERGIVFRLVGNNKGANGYLAYRQELRQGMDIFLVLGDPNAESFTPRIGLKIVNTY